MKAHHAHKFIFGGHDPGVCACNHGALASWLLGYPDQALALSRESIALAQALSHPMSLLLARCFASFLHQFRGEPQAVHEHAEAAFAICTEHGIAPHYVATARIMRGWAAAALGEVEAGAAELRDGLADLLATEMNARRPHYLALLAETEAWAGRLDQGLAALGEAQELVDRTEERRWEAEIHRLTGELLLRMDPSGKSAEAEARFAQAMRVAGDQGAGALELRAATSLARLWGDNGKREEARDLLATVYGRFVEGFETPDLKRAKALLDELSRASLEHAELQNTP
jgi:predicted ATPase